MGSKRRVGLSSNIIQTNQNQFIYNLILFWDTKDIQEINKDFRKEFGIPDRMAIPGIDM